MLPAFLILLASLLFTSLKLLVFPTGSGIHAVVVVALYFSCLVWLEIMLLLQSLLQLSSLLLPTFQASFAFFCWLPAIVDVPNVARAHAVSNVHAAC
jgi:hypothetical protein